MQCLYFAGTMTECRHRRGVHVQEVSIRRGLTVSLLASQTCINRSTCTMRSACHSSSVTVVIKV